MARNGSGTYSLVSGNPVTTGSTISSTWANNTLSDIATALTGSIAADGQTPITGNLMMSGYKHTGAGSANASGQYLVYGQSSAALADLTLSGALNVTGVVTMVVPSAVLINDSTSYIADNGDATKRLAFQASGITTGTTRTWTVGNYSGIPAVPVDEGAANQCLISSGAGTQPTWGSPTIADNSVTTAKILDGNVTAAKLSGGQSGSAPIYGCRAWVNFNGTGTPAIRASGNVTSITDHGTGDYTINFTTAMPDANYAVVGSTSYTPGGATAAPVVCPVTYAVGSVRINITRYTDGLVDTDYINVAIFR